ncbi:MAG TPA: thioredoxin [Candidatus Aminicenantes bacterium]|nr:thioredoxin [Candidatus Aminicenantes bacterium]
MESGITAGSFQWLALLVAVVAAFIIGVQVWAYARARRMRGRTAPLLKDVCGRDFSGGKPVLIYFYAPGCRACRSMTPLMRELQQERNDVFVLNAAAERHAAQAFGVMATPATVRVDDGRITDVILGARSRKALLQMLRDQ